MVTDMPIFILMGQQPRPMKYNSGQGHRLHV